jgi:hypothetical protein
MTLVLTGVLGAIVTTGPRGPDPADEVKASVEARRQLDGDLAFTDSGRKRFAHARTC